MKRIFLFLLISTLTVGLSPAWSQTGQTVPEKAAPSAEPENVQPTKPEMMPKMQDMLKEMQQMLGQKQLTPEQQKKMQDMVTKMQGMMTQMHEKMMAMPKEKMEMCPMMQKMEAKEEIQNNKIKNLEERLDKLEKACGKAK